MHELGIMTGVVDSVRESALANGACKVFKVSLRVGVMTEVIEESLTFAYEALTEHDPLFSGSELTVTMVEPRSRCTACGLEFSHDRYHVTCPDCGGLGRLLEGRELCIDSIEVDIPDEASSPDEASAAAGNPDLDEASAAASAPFATQDTPSPQA